MLQLLWENNQNSKKAQLKALYSDILSYLDVFCVYKEKKHTKKQPTQAYYQHFVVYKKKTEIN